MKSERTYSMKIYNTRVIYILVISCERIDKPELAMSLFEL